jgi:hypothetical protein
VRILRGLGFGSVRMIGCGDPFDHGSPFYMLSKGTKVIHVSIAKFLIVRGAPWRDRQCAEIADEMWSGVLRGLAQIRMILNLFK